MSWNPLKPDPAPVISRAGIYIQPEDLQGIEDAQLAVELIIDPYCMYTRSWRAETYDHRPLNADYRLDEDAFVWMVYSARAPPHAAIGLQGDVWIDCTPAAVKIYFRGESNTWVLWDNPCKHDGRHRDQDGREVAHPWLPDRCLQFNGFDLGWFAHSDLKAHQQRWDAVRGKLPPYDQLSAQYIVDFRTTMERASLSRRVIQPDRRLHAPNSSKVVKPKQVMDCGVSRPNALAGAVRASSSNDTSSSPVSLHNMKLRNSAGKAGRQNPPKRPFWVLSDSDSGSEDGAPAPKRASKGKERELPPSRRPATRAQDTSGVGTVLASSDNLHGFLEELPLKLVHRSAAFQDLGITSRAHIDALAHIPTQLQEVLFKELRNRNVVLVETLVLRSALNTIRDSSAQPNPAAGRAQAQPKDVAAFLALMHPPMSHRLPVLRNLGVDASHLPVLAGLDEESYKVFEGELGAAGVTWVERLLLRASLRNGL